MGTLIRRVLAFTNRRGDRWFAGSDARARSAGWEVTRSRSGLSRTYRDPRFDQTPIRTH